MKAWTRFPFFFNHILHSPLWDFVMQLFKKYGEKTVFICRMCPGIRSMITIPAKKSNMKLLKFVVYSFFGMLIWGLTWLLLSVWVFDDSVTEQLILKLCSAIAVIIALIIGVNYFIYRKAQKDKTSSK
jgi:membrane protein DedA with SNARE-associated domain